MRDYEYMISRLDVIFVLYDYGFVSLLQNFIMYQLTILISKILQVVLGQI